MAGGSNGYQAAPVRRQLTPGLISSLPGTVGLQPFISFSTSYRILHPPQPREEDEVRDTWSAHPATGRSLAVVASTVGAAVHQAGRNGRRLPIRGQRTASAQPPCRRESSPRSWRGAKQDRRKPQYPDRNRGIENAS